MGGADQVQASNISKTYDEKKYFATYFQDDWKVTPRLTLNLGLRWDYFGPINETNGGQANFAPSGPPTVVRCLSFRRRAKITELVSELHHSACEGWHCTARDQQVWQRFGADAKD